MLNFIINTVQAAVLPNFNQSQNLPAFISSVYSFALTIVGIAVFIRILYAGFLWLTAAGNASKASDAKGKITNAVIGAILLFAAYLILYVINPDLVRNTFNLNLSKNEEMNYNPGRVSQEIKREFGEEAYHWGKPSKLARIFGGEALGSSHVTVSQDGALTVDLAGGGQYKLTPVGQVQAGAAIDIFEELRDYGFSAGDLVFAQYQVNDPVITPLEIMNMTGSPPPEEIVGVAGSLFLYDARRVSGNRLKDIVEEIALEHYAVDFTEEDFNEEDSGGTSSGTVGSLRYLKIDSSSNSWISWREIEVYDGSGSKIIPTSITASCTLCNYPGNPATTSPDKVYDGDLDSVWNAGETAPGCNWLVPDKHCPGGSATRVAWIQLDLGSVKNVSRVKLMTDNYPNPASATHKVLIGSNGDNFTEVARFSGNVFANRWLEYPYLVRPATALLTFNGTKNLTIKPGILSGGEGALARWSGTGGDYADFTVTGEIPKCLNLFYNDPDLTKNYLGGQRNLLFSVANYTIGSATSSQKCNLGKTVTISYRVFQWGATEPAASDTVTIQFSNVIANLSGPLADIESCYFSTSVDIESWDGNFPTQMFIVPGGTETGRVESRKLSGGVCDLPFSAQPLFGAPLSASIGSAVSGEGSSLLYHNLSVTALPNAAGGLYFIRINGPGGTFTDLPIRIDGPLSHGTPTFVPTPPLTSVATPISSPTPPPQPVAVCMKFQSGQQFVCCSGQPNTLECPEYNANYGYGCWGSWIAFAFDTVDSCGQCSSANLNTTTSCNSPTARNCTITYHNGMADTCE